MSVDKDAQRVVLQALVDNPKFGKLNANQQELTLDICALSIEAYEAAKLRK